jgi:gamma-glutamylputrescine oxidase
MLPPSFPRGEASYWQAQAATAPMVGGPPPRAADYVVIGAGLAGISTARSILEWAPGASIAVLESRTVGYGASGRNSGLLSPLPVPVWLLTAGKGNDSAWALKTLNARVHALGETLRALSPAGEATSTDLHLHAMGRITGAGLDTVARALDAAGIAHDVRTEPERYGLRTLSLPTVSVNPYALVCALAEDARARGILICTRTPVASVMQNGGRARVLLESGHAIDAGCVVVCTNAYTGGLGVPAGARRAKAVRNYMLATEPLEADLARRLGAGRRFVVEIDRSYVFYRVHAGRLVYGGIESFKEIAGSDFAVPDEIRRQLARLVGRSIGGDCPPIAYTWSGRYHATVTETPIIARHPKAPAIVMNVGYGGTGVALTQIFSGLAASIATGQPQADPDMERLGRILQGTRLPVRGLVSFGTAVARQLLLGGRAPA